MQKNQSTKNCQISIEIIQSATMRNQEIYILNLPTGFYESFGKKATADQHTLLFIDLC